MTVNEIINTLAKDETNPEVNKTAIVELAKAVAEIGGGTKLYKHNTRITGEGYDIELSFTSSIPSYTTQNLEQDFEINFGGQVVSTTEGQNGALYGGYCDLGELVILFIDSDGRQALYCDLSLLENVADNSIEL